MKKVIAFLNQTEIKTNISMEFSLWLQRYITPNIIFIENDHEDDKHQNLISYSQKRSREKQIYSYKLMEIDFSLKIDTFRSTEDFKTLLSTVNEEIIITNINYKNDYNSYFRKITHLFVLVDNSKKITLTERMKVQLNEMVPDLKVNSIFLSKKSHPETDFLFYNYRKENNSTFFKRNYNQICFSNMGRHLNLYD